MSDIVAALIRQSIASLAAAQNALQNAGRQENAAGQAETPDAELIVELRDTLDRVRGFLWSYTGPGGFRHEGEDPPAGKDDHRLQLVSEFLWLLSRRAAPQEPAREENMSFFERIDSLSDRLLAEHPENKSTSKAA